ncbi:MAG TPA: cyclic-phosphate processing receiver domain-containing protein [Planctomycetota bacterium]|nr:cyclic-phosphate processing receiver domain-containing protein [Planctomycetota bacterium]
MPLAENRSFHLFLDDVRHPSEVTWITLPAVPWTIVRDFDAFVAAVHEHGIPATVSFDHDLTAAHYEALDHGRRTPGTGYDESLVKTGYHCARWLVDQCLAHDLPLPEEVFVHTMNPVGRDKIQALLELARNRGR